MAPENATKQKDKKTSLPRKLCCSSGHIINELLRQMAFSFNLIFLIKVAGLSGKEAGLIFLLGQIVGSVTGPLVGYCSDNVVLPLLGRCLGRRKAWHFIGTISMAILFALKFTPCLICHDNSPQRIKVAYYAIMSCMVDVAFPAIDISHLSIISVVAKNQEECVGLNVLR